MQHAWRMFNRDDKIGNPQRHRQVVCHHDLHASPRHKLTEPEVCLHWILEGVRLFLHSSPCSVDVFDESNYKVWFEISYSLQWKRRKETIVMIQCQVKIQKTMPVGFQTGNCFV